MNHAVRCTYLFLLCLSLSHDISTKAHAQPSSLDIAGEWNVNLGLSSYCYIAHISFERNGQDIVGNLRGSGCEGKLTGLVHGNTLTGSFNYSSALDRSNSGQMELTFSSDGSQFSGSARESWDKPWKRFAGELRGDLLVQRTLLQIAKIDEVRQSGLPLDRQAEVACNNILHHGYRQQGDLWTTSYVRETHNNSFAPVLGLQEGRKTLYFQAKGVRRWPIRVENLSPADRANGVFKASLTISGQLVRVYDNGQWGPWYDNTVVFDCHYSLKKNELDISATGFGQGSAEKFIRPQSIPQG